jgi:hypothetical protein
MFSQTWKKYLPVITLFLKRVSTNPEQVLSLNNTDFERAAGGRKVKNSFTHLQINKGRINNEAKQSNVAKELGYMLKEEETTKYIIANLFLEFSMNNDYKLTIRNTAHVEEVTTEVVADTNVEELIVEEAVTV